MAKSAIYQILVRKQHHGDRLLWRSSEHEPRGTFQPAEQGAFKRRLEKDDVDKTLKDARKDLVNLLEAKGTRNGWKSRSWESYRRLIEIDGGSYLPPWSKFQSFSDQVLSALGALPSESANTISGPAVDEFGNNTSADLEPTIDNMTMNENTMKEFTTNNSTVQPQTSDE